MGAGVLGSMGSSVLKEIRALNALKESKPLRESVGNDTELGDSL